MENESSYFVKSTLAETIGKLVSKNKDKKERKIIIQRLKQLTWSRSFQNIVSTGAINGLSYFANETDKNIKEKIVNFILDKTTEQNDYFTRSTAIRNLPKFIKISSEDDTDIKNLNFKIFFKIINLMNDEHRKVKINAINAIIDKNNKIMLPDVRVIYLISILRYISHYDVDGFVRKVARKGLRVVNSWIEEYLKQPSLNLIHDEKELDIEEICKNIKLIQNTFK